MRTALATQIEAAPAVQRAIQTTLLELVEAVSDAAETEAEVVSTIVHMLRSGRVELCGSFKGAPIDEF